MEKHTFKNALGENTSLVSLLAMIPLFRPPSYFDSIKKRKFKTEIKHTFAIMN